MSTPTLAEFLLARIAEDEARALAECEAKRRIVKAWSAVPDEGTPFSSQARETAGHVFRCMASVYGDHPDYRADWRP